MSSLLNNLKGEARKSKASEIKRAENIMKEIIIKLKTNVERLDSVDIEILKELDFAYKQAFRIGYKKCLTDLEKYGIIKE